MTERAINLLFRKSAYGTSNTYELARLGLALVAVDIPVRAIFEGNSVNCLLRGQRPEGIGIKPITDILMHLGEYGADMMVVSEALIEHGIALNDLLESLELQLVERKEIGSLIETSRFTIEV